MKAFFSTCLLSWLLLAGALAGEPEPAPLVSREAAAPSPFARGAKEFQFVTGGFRFFDPGSRNNDLPSVDFVYQTLRLGIMLNDPRGSNFLAGNFEALGEVFAGEVVQGPGNVAAGATLIFRYNFIQPRARLVPYLQFGGGGVYTDISEEESRGLVSLPVEFNLHGTVGLRYLVNQRWSLVFEAGYRHISNAGFSSVNRGIDSAGGNVGFGFSF